MRVQIFLSTVNGTTFIFGKKSNDIASQA